MPYTHYITKGIYCRTNNVGRSNIQFYLNGSIHGGLAIGIPSIGSYRKELPADPSGPAGNSYVRLAL